MPSLNIDPQFYPLIATCLTILGAIIVAIYNRRPKSIERDSHDLSLLAESRNTLEREREELRAVIAAKDVALARKDQELTETMHELEDALLGSGAAVIAANEAGRIVHVSGICEEILGWTCEELLGRPIIMLIPTRLRASYIQGYAQFVRTKSLVLAHRPIGTFALRKDGAEREIEMVYAAYSGMHGESVIAIIRDMRDWVHFEQGEPSELEDTLAFARAIADRRPEGVIIADANAFVIYANHAAASLYQIDGVGLPVRDYAALVRMSNPSTGEPIGPNALPMMRALKGERTEMDYQILDLDGSALALHGEAEPVTDLAGAILGAVLTVTRVPDSP